MAKLYFKYGVMGSSKTAQALITKFNYEEKGMRVLFLKPPTDTRDGLDIVKSRINGLEAVADVFTDNTLNVEDFMYKDVIIVDEAQFLTVEQINCLRAVVDIYEIPVLCFGLRTDFLGNLFEGSKRLMEISDCIEEIKTMCQCGRKATMNMRIDAEGKPVKSGDVVMMGGNDSYIGLCSSCWNYKMYLEDNEANARPAYFKTRNS